MAAGVIPHLANDKGVEKIFVGVKELNCMGARPPFDHPHVYLDMGSDGQILCPYCSTLYVYDGRLHADESDPANAIVSAEDLAAA
ncbi:MAG: zinc-finger domain-containing protein [Hyphomicrobiaceae bacterium]